MTMFNTKEYHKEYSKTHKAEIAKQQAEYRKELRQQVIELYSHGTCKCSHCGGPVEELHHTNPEDGKWEKKEFGGQSCIAARHHQIEMYTVIPDYIQPLCKKCHKEIHKNIMEVMVNG